MAANGGGGGVGHARSKSDPSQLLPDHEPIRPHGFGVRRRSISVDSVYFYFGGYEGMEAVTQFVTSTVKARRDRIDAVLRLWLPSSSSSSSDDGGGGHVRSKSDPQLLSDHDPIRPHGFSVLRRSISMDSVGFYFRGIDHEEVIDSVHQFVTRTADARWDFINALLNSWHPYSSSDDEDDAHDGNGDGDGDGSDDDDDDEDDAHDGNGDGDGVGSDDDDDDAHDGNGDGDGVGSDDDDDDDDENVAHDGNGGGALQPAAPHGHGGADLAAPAA